MIIIIIYNVKVFIYVEGMMLLHLSKVLTQDEVHYLLAQLQQAWWVDGKQTVGEQGAKSKRNRQINEHSPEAKVLGDYVLQALKRHPLFYSAVLPLRIAPPLFNAYADGEHYGWHVDGAIRQVPEHSAPYHVLGAEYTIRTDVSATLFLSAPETYDGGELEIMDTYGSHEVKLPAGDMIIYPSTSLHQVKPVTRGVRVCSFFWNQSLIREASKRNMLYEMDQTIQSLRHQMGDSPEVLSLTMQYHNLIRLWSEV